METYSINDLLRTDTANGTYLVGHDENGIVIVLIDKKFNKIGPEIRGKVQGQG